MGRNHYLPRGPCSVTIQVVSQNRVALGNHIGSEEKKFSKKVLPNW